MGDRFATIGMGRGLRTQAALPASVNPEPYFAAAVLLLWGGELGPHLTQCGLGEADLRTKWQLDPSSRLATIDMGRKWGLLCPFLWELGPRLTQCGLDRGHTSIPSGILIHPTVWPQCTNVTDRTDRHTTAEGEQFYRRSPKKNKNRYIE